MKRNKRKRGFTLVELIAVLSILAVIMVLVLPKGNKQIENSKKIAIKSEAKALVDVATTLKMEGKLNANKSLDEITMRDIYAVLNTDELKKEYFQTLPKRIRNISPYNGQTMAIYQKLANVSLDKIELDGEYFHTFDTSAD